jgi:predicted ATP-binding protein involved in virulence
MFKFESIDHSSKEGTFQIKVKPEDSNQVLLLQKISQGTFSVIAICCVVHNFLKSIYGNSEDIYTKPAIVIIDELDAHIHPSWQSKLIGIFRQHFPAIQFVISAHSPLLIRGCRAGEASVLRRTNKGKFRIQTIDQPLFGLSIEELHSMIFEIESTDSEMLRYKEIAVFKDQYLDELKKLIEADEITPSEENAIKINELQDRINYIGIAEKSYDDKKAQKKSEMNVIMNFQHTAVQDDTAANQPPNLNS